MYYKQILNQISCAYKEILKDNLVGIYVHGSIAFGCFNHSKSDIDFLAVTKSTPSQEEKVMLIQILLDLESSSPPKGIEMSVVLERNCLNFTYPTPFELHFSNSHLEKCGVNLEEYCAVMNGTDKDLAAHFTVIKTVGIAWYGKSIESVFGDVPKHYYLDSIKNDIENSENEIRSNPVYIILNLCRVLAFIREDLVISKEQGALWGIKNLPHIYNPLIEEALKSYQFDDDFLTDNKLAERFSRYMTEQIFSE